MFRYVALAWDGADPNQANAARMLGDRLQARHKQWGRTGNLAGLCVFHSALRHESLRAYLLPHGNAVLLGSLFHRNHDCSDEGAAAPFTADHRQSEQILASRGRWLIDHVWGNYVAVLRDPVSRRSWAVKDPCGNLPCLRASFGGVQIVFGHLADLVATGLFEFTINPRYLRNRMLHGGVLDHDALNEVERVYRGECAELSDGPRPRNRVFHWHPLSFARSSEIIEDAAAAAQAMRATVRSSVRTLCSGHQSVLHRLSGGLDSSIIAACLAAVPDGPDLCCYTYYAPGGRSDERPWARLAAGCHGLKHEEYPITPDDIPLPAILDAPPLVEPIQIMGYLHRSTLEQRISREHEATAVFCGDGGDSGFCGDTFAYAVSEYLRRHGIGMQAFRLAAKVAAITEEASWTVMLKSLRRWRHGAGMEHQRKMMLPASRLLSEELRASYSSVTTFPHPWLSHLHPVPWALVRRLGEMLSSPEFYNVAAGIGAPEVIAPLYSQPAMELFLRIPVDVHFHGGRERGLARRAFAPEVPKEILRRHWKDRAPGFLDRLVQRHRKFLRELLLDGVLVEERLLNRAAVEEALCERISSSAVFPGELLLHLDVEIWARQWRRSGNGAARAGATA
jgi:asparagine synthase (glutamine-hydrolysing)